MITSVNNPRVKEIVRLQTKSSQRKRSGLFCVETERELRRAIAAGFQITDSYVCPELYRGQMPPAGYTVVSEPVLRKIAYRENPQGLVVVMRAKTTPLAQAPRDGMIVVLSALEKPGNIGAILRSADAAGAGAVMIDQCDFDVFNPNTVRASTGAVFSLPIVCADRETLIDCFKQRGTKIIALSPDGSIDYTQADLGGDAALVLGAEAEGLDAAWRDAADLLVRIAMRGTVDSLNVSVSAALVMFEAVRVK
ncbi:RNA methyltransferase [Planctomycetales bacterium ZRK34]|nr:RNA methyltransferase [Planctomycetales bacterium ZRK34]